ncbi:phospho-sugar mutase [Thermasporomyces composti]|uniref:Phosphomannomutase n=1 Tax=Thermasporomyces composti TaxID=696763 RepID=A0A3D9VEB8_THECX|nr:phospho-sugar mutase [Thermasporomyces composti]REF37455.1 phosphomannomutase [Thermasporomyces composti]
MSDPTALVDQARAWLADDPDPRTRAELSDLLTAVESGDERARALLADQFAGTLQFGTAGLRGPLGPGPNRMNRVVVARAAAGLASYLLAHGHRGAPVVVGYDARYNSDVFATDTVAVLAGAGLRPLLLPRPLPTPVLAFAIRRLNCAAGVMVTASHNPRQDNGYKVYLGDGSQIVPPVDAEIAAAMSEVSSVARIPRGDSWTVVGEDVVHDYLDRVASLPATDPQAFRDLRIVYTPLHGVGGPLVEEALRRAGFAPPAVVPEQAAPDPGFPTTPFPNPEEPGTLDLALELGRRTDADVVLANDPDADRLAVAVPTEEGFRRLTGDEVGALLAVHLLNAGARGTLATTVVSSTLLSSIATAHGVPYTQTLTGFKWLGRVPDLAFAYEEALGYCVDPEAVRDKDGISALIRMAELVAALKREGRTLLDLLDDIAREHDLHATAQHAVWVRDLSEIDAVLERLRQRPPLALGGREVLRTDDLAEPTDGLPPTVGLRFVLAGRARVVIRPSGTEPKLKCYVEVIVPAREDLAAAKRIARDALAAIGADVRELVGA